MLGSCRIGIEIAVSAVSASGRYLDSVYMSYPSDLDMLHLKYVQEVHKHNYTALTIGCPKESSLVEHRSQTSAMHVTQNSTD